MVEAAHRHDNLKSVCILALVEPRAWVTYLTELDVRTPSNPLVISLTQQK